MPTDRPTSLGTLDVERYLSDPALRQAYVTPMFDMIAPKYDRFTRVFSFGMDRGWKADLIAMAAHHVPNQGTVADVATGTGDLAYRLASSRPDVDIAAVDVSMPMLALALQRSDGVSRVVVSGGDLSALPFADRSLDAVTAGYALRNTPDWHQSVAELARVIRPGGNLFTLDFYLPTLAAWRVVLLGWLWATGRLVGWLWHREPMAYGYIAHSIAHFTTAGAFSDVLEQSGFQVVATHRRLGGGIAIHHARRR